MARAAHPFEALSWSDLLAALEQLTGEERMCRAGFSYAEITDLVQGQLFLRHPMLALRMARVIELRFAARNAVVYLRTGIALNSETASPEVGPFLVTLLQLDPQSGEHLYVKYPRIKRMRNWRNNLRRRLCDLLHDVESGRTGARGLAVAHSLPDLFSPEGDDLESDLVWRCEVPGGELWAQAADTDTLSAAHMAWGDLQAAGVSLPVWMSVAASLLLVLAVLLAR